MIVVRFGLLILGAFVFLDSTITPLPLDFSTWYGTMAIAPLLVGSAIVLFAFYNSLAGRPIFGETLVKS